MREALPPRDSAPSDRVRGTAAPNGKDPGRGRLPRASAGVASAPLQLWNSVLTRSCSYSRQTPVSSATAPNGESRRRSVPPAALGASTEGGPARVYAAPFASLTASVSAGTTSKRSATTPTSATSKMGASGSLLMATMKFEPFIPTRCWMAPEIPQAM